MKALLKRRFRRNRRLGAYYASRIVEGRSARGHVVQGEGVGLSLNLPHEMSASSQWLDREGVGGFVKPGGWWT